MRDRCFTRHEFQIKMIKKSFERIKRINPEYSLRQFSTYLKISHSTLSLLFNNKRFLSKKTAEDLAHKLELTKIQKQIFLSKYDIHNEETEDANEITQDQFSFISEWQHYAILSLLDTEDFKMNAAWISERLNISTTLVKTTIERLKRIGIIEMRSDGKWIQTGGPIRFKNKSSTLANKKFQKQILKKSMEAISNIPYEIRDSSLIVFAMDPSQIDYAVNRIRQFRYELSNELESFGNKKEVYNLSVQLFPLTKINTNN